MGRTYKSIKNICFGIFALIVTTIMSFITRTVMVQMIGLEAVSLNGLFHEVIATLSLAELGIGSTIVYNLYKPLAENDVEKVCQLMTFFKKIYRLIAAVTFLLGVIVCFFVPVIVNDISYSNGYIRVVFMLFVVQIASSYLFTYKVSLLNADQNSYIYSIVTSISKVVGAILLLMILVYTKNYIFYLIGNIFVTVSTNIIASIVVDKRYTYLCDKTLPKEDKKTIFDNVKNIFIKQLSGKITNSTDNILISVMVSTVMVGYYSFYSLIIGVVKQLIDKVEVGIKASMGNLFVKGTNEECIKVLRRLTWGYSAFATVGCVGIYVCIEPFITLWMGAEYLLARSILLVLCLNLYCYIASKPIYSAMHVSGLFVEGRNISIVGSVINLIVSIVLGKYLGMLGIFIGTMCTYIVQIISKIYYVYKLKFYTSSRKYIWMWVKSIIILMTMLFANSYICNRVLITNLIVTIIVRALIVIVSCLLILVVCYVKTEEFTYFWKMIKRILKNK